MLRYLFFLGILLCAQSICAQRSVRKLEISNEQLDTLERTENFNVRSLSIKAKRWGDTLALLPETIFLYDSLTLLELKNVTVRDWDALYARIAAIPNLKTLIVSNCYGNCFTAGIASLQNLQRLEISAIYNRYPMHAVFELTNLEHLDLSFCSMEELSPEIGKLTKLKSLDLSGNRLKELPPTIAQLQHLEKLWLTYNAFREIPEAVLQLTQLREIDLGENKVSAVPENIVQLRSLQKLSLDWNRLRELPERFAQMDSLEHLDISMNRFRTVPAVVLGCDRLKTLMCWCPHMKGHQPVLRVLHSSAYASAPGFQDSLQLYRGVIKDWNKVFSGDETVRKRSSFKQDVLPSLHSSYTATSSVSALLLRNRTISLYSLCRWRERKNPVYDAAEHAELWLDFPLLPFGARRMNNLQSIEIDATERWTPTWKWLRPLVKNNPDVRSLTIYDPFMKRVPKCIHRMDKLEMLSLDCMQLEELPDWLADLPNLRNVNIRNSVKVPDELRSKARFSITYF
jgi:Leucine-rich repeat (LRR) protein